MFTCCSGQSFHEHSWRSHKKKREVFKVLRKILLYVPIMLTWNVLMKIKTDRMMRTKRSQCLVNYLETWNNIWRVFFCSIYSIQIQHVKYISTDHFNTKVPVPPPYYPRYHTLDKHITKPNIFSGSDHGKGTPWLHLRMARDIFVKLFLRNSTITQKSIEFYCFWNSVVHWYVFVIWIQISFLARQRCRGKKPEHSNWDLLPPERLRLVLKHQRGINPNDAVCS